jgi:hypothetical protein
MKIEIDEEIIDEDILADADAYDRARQGKLTATPAVHAVAPVAVMDEGDEAARLRAERDAAITIGRQYLLQVAEHEIYVGKLRRALDAVAREATYDSDGDSLTRGERLDEVRRIALVALA